MRNKILVLKIEKIIKTLRMNVEVTRGIKYLTLYIYIYTIDVLDINLCGEFATILNLKIVTRICR